MYNNKLVAAIAIGGKIVREQGEKVYIPFGSEYQIYLKNENSRKVLVRIEVDGLNVFSDNSRCVLNAGESHYLSTRMEGGKHYNLKFIEKTNQIEQFRGNKAGDGLIKISYQFVKEPVQVNYTYTKSEHDPYIIKTPTYPWSHTYGAARRLDGGNYGVHGGNLLGSPSFPGGIFINSTTNTIGTPISGVVNATGELPIGAFTNSCYIGAAGFTSTITTASTPAVNNHEGITVNGNKRDDVFYAHVYETDPLETTEHVMVLQLQGGFPEIPVTAIKFTRTKIQCSSCGTKNTSNNKFCGQCGTGLEL